MEFKLNRFSALLKREYILNKRLIFFSFIALIGLLFVALALSKANNDNGSFFLAVYVLFLFIAGGLWISSSQNDFSTENRRIQYFSLPASILEKFISKFFITLPLYFIPILLSVYLMYTIWNFFLLSIPKEGSYSIPYMLLYFTAIFTFFHSIAFMFSFIFNRMAAIKGFVICLVAYLLIGFIWALIHQLGGHGGDFGDVFSDKTWKMAVAIGDHPIQLACIAPIFWFVSYFIFKSKSV